MPETLRPVGNATFLRSAVVGRPVGVDRAKAILNGYVVAQLGVFKSSGRGEFDLAALKEIVRLGNASTQLKSRFNHETACDTALGKYLGRPRTFGLSHATNAEGKSVPAVRADLHFDQTALQEPPGGGKPLGLYVMDLAENDPDALSSSLVLRAEQVYRRKKDGTLETDGDGNELPPLWIPKRLYGSDIVDTGDAVDGLLSADSLPDGLQWKGAQLLDANFPDMTRAELADRLRGWMDRYLDRRYGPEEVPSALAPTPETTPSAAAEVGEKLSTYGFCPKCGEPGVTRERRLGGNDQCKAGHTYPSAAATPAPPAAPRGGAARPNRDRAAAILARCGLTVRR